MHFLGILIKLIVLYIPLRKKLSGKNLNCWKRYFQFLCGNWVFWTNMESTSAVTLHFEDLAVQNYFFLKDVCLCRWKISNCSQKHFWWLWNRVRERAFFTLSGTLSCVVFKIFKKKKITFIKSAFVNNLRFFINKCTHLLKTSNFGPQSPQNAALQQRYSPC